MAIVDFDDVTISDKERYVTVRSIKFRVWYKPTNQFINHCSVGNGIVQHDTRNFAVLEDKDCVVQQYTGLKDKNRVDIYEGDLIISDHWRSDEHMVVSWDCDSCKFYASLPSGGDRIDLDEAKKLVVGNIFEGADK